MCPALNTRQALGDGHHVLFICVFVFWVVRERLIRLQHENKMLKLAQEGSDNEQIALLQSLLEDANSRKNELETENR